MPADYRALYMQLFNAQTSAILSLERTSDMLKKVQQEVEAAVMEAPDAAITLMMHPEETDKKEE